METTARELVRVERRLREARGYSDAYGRLLQHSARKVLAASGFELPDESRPIPIDPDAVEDQIRRFTDRPPSGRSPRSSTAANYAENWRRFARWTRDYLRAEASGGEDIYLRKLGSGAPKRSRRSDAARASENPDWLLAASAPPDRLASMPSPMHARRSAGPDGGFAYPASRDERAADDLRVVTVRTSFGPFRMELPQDLRAEDAARIAAAVLRLVD